MAKLHLGLQGCREVGQAMKEGMNEWFDRMTEKRVIILVLSRQSWEDFPR